jgi:tetratricopeptide (TPR) repeat protein
VSHQISKQTLKHDEFSESMIAAVGFFKRHTTEALAIAVGALIIIVGLAFISQNRAKSEREAGMMLSSVQGALFSGQYQQAEQGFNEIVKRFGSSNAAKEALLNLGNLDVRQGRTDQALAFFTRCVKASPSNPLVLYGALTGAAACHEQKGDFAKAADSYSQVAKKLPKEQYFASEALLSAGRCYENAKLPDKARACYQQVLDQYAQTQATAQAKVQLTMLSVQ